MSEVIVFQKPSESSATHDGITVVVPGDSSYEAIEIAQDLAEAYQTRDLEGHGNSFSTTCEQDEGNVHVSSQTADDPDRDAVCREVDDAVGENGSLPIFTPIIVTAAVAMTIARQRRGAH